MDGSRAQFPTQTCGRTTSANRCPHAAKAPEAMTKAATHILLTDCYLAHHNPTILTARCAVPAVPRPPCMVVMTVAIQGVVARDVGAI